MQRHKNPAYIRVSLFNIPIKSFVFHYAFYVEHIMLMSSEIIFNE